MSTLDSIQDIRSLDPGNMYNRIFDFPEQLTDAQKISAAWKIDAQGFAGIKNIVVIGMGGSAIGGDLVRSLLANKLLVPFQVCRNYVLPEYVDDETLVIASSYSGNTEETLSAVEDALGRKALMVAITTGGLLEDVAKLNDIPYIKIPGGLQPRAALGYSFVPLLLFFEKIGLVKGLSAQLTAAIARIQKTREQFIEDLPTEKNPAKRLAAQIIGKIPVVYAGPTLSDVVAVRWKGQLCENGKNLAFANTYPEFNHNELVGWSETIASHKEHLIVIQLRDSDDHPKVSRRMDTVRGIIEKQGIKVVEFQSVGSNSLERMLSLIQMGDFVSYYLAILNGVDPTPVEAIETLKKELGK
ncbi:MAG: bifunctional phosphoglucose/phosphomannose isomerase [candidate division Zixibacteria bacterium]|nr:bifunctional phosphoglucose/phosphomannose isomerase [candidate division Zixibacteria bacterium]